MSHNQIKILFLIILFIAFTVNLPSYDIDYKIQQWQRRMLELERLDPPFEKGERLIYNVNFKGINIGRAELLFTPKAHPDNPNTNFISFNANLHNFYDLEEIYGDKITFLPLRVKRTLNILGQPMNIDEVYDQKQNLIKIIKNKNGASREQKIQSDAPLDNIILVIYRLRKFAKLNLGDTFDFNLPTRKIKMEVKRIERINVAAGSYNAYYIESTPSKFKIWLDTSNNRLPLKVEGVAFWGLATMSLREVK